MKITIDNTVTYEITDEQYARIKPIVDEAKVWPRELLNR